MFVVGPSQKKPLSDETLTIFFFPFLFWPEQKKDVFLAKIYPILSKENTMV